jgi:hypothetical protein
MLYEMKQNPGSRLHVTNPSLGIPLLNPPVVNYGLFPIFWIFSVPLTAMMPA